MFLIAMLISLIIHQQLSEQGWKKIVIKKYKKSDFFNLNQIFLIYLEFLKMFN